MNAAACTKHFAVYLLNAGIGLSILLCVGLWLNSEQAALVAKERQWGGNTETARHASVKELISLLKNNAYIVLDTRSRANYAKGHILGAVNIPVEELEMRSKRELSSFTGVVIYCGSDENCEQGSLTSGKPTVCGIALNELSSQFDRNHLVIAIGLIPELRQGGIPIVSDNYAVRHAWINE